MRYKFFLSITLLSLITLFSCGDRKRTIEVNGSLIDEDYILIEFAAKLEEDYHKLQDQNSDNSYKHH